MRITRYNGPITSGGTSMLYVPEGFEISGLPEVALRKFNAQRVGQGSFDLDGPARFGVNPQAIRAGIEADGFYVSKLVIEVQVQNVKH